MQENSALVSDIQQRYIQLLQRALTCSLWEGGDGSLVPPRGILRRTILWMARAAGLRVVRPTRPGEREAGLDWPALAHSMMGEKRLANLVDSVKTVLKDNVPGDFIETGVWRGGACILMRGILAAYGSTDRKVWVADSFAGLPAPDPRIQSDQESTLHELDLLAVSLETVKKNFAAYGLLDDQVQFLKGWFKDTLPTAPIDQLALIRLDGDMYESTRDALTALYKKLSVGGFVIVDDYTASLGCRTAITEFRATHGIVEPIQEIDGAGVYWRKQH